VEATLARRKQIGDVRPSMAAWGEGLGLGEAKEGEAGEERGDDRRHYSNCLPCMCIESQGERECGFYHFQRTERSHGETNVSWSNAVEAAEHLARGD
jgi:hypothetical protein